MKQRQHRWIWPVLLVLLAGCETPQPAAQPPDPAPPAVTSAAEAPSPRVLLADADGVTLAAADRTMFAGSPEPTDCTGVLTVQANPEGASEFGPMEQTDDQYRFYCYAAVNAGGEDMAFSLAVKADETVVSAYCPGDQKPYLLVDTPEGQVLQLPDETRISLTDSWDGDARAQWLVGSADGLLAICPDGQAAAFGLTGQPLWTERYAGTIRAALVTAANEPQLLTQWDTLTVLQTVNLADGRLTPVGIIPEALCDCRLFSGDRWGYDLLALDGEALYGCQAGETTVYRLWTPADQSLEADRIAGLACLRDDTMLLLYETEEAAISRIFAWLSPAGTAPVESPAIRPLEEAAAYDKSTAVVKREELLGLTMEVPEEYARDLTCNLSPLEIFSFYDGETLAAAAEPLEGYGWCWSVLAYSREEYEARYQQDFDTWAEDYLSPLDLQLGRDESYMYICQFPTDVRHDPDSLASRKSYYLHYLRGYSMLTDFMERNGITPSPNWDAAYRKELQGKSVYAGNFETVEFGCGDTAGAEPALLELAAQIPNLSSYNGDPSLTWQDALTYRLNHAYLSSDVRHSEDEKAQIIRSARPVYDYSIYYGEPGSNETMALAALYDFTAQLQAEPALSEACQSNAWAIHVVGDRWYLIWPGGILESDPAEVYEAILDSYDS